LKSELANSIDALLPPEMAEKAEHVGVEKTRLDATSLMALAVLAGAFVAFGSMFSVVVSAGAEGVLPYGVTRLLAGLVFSLGLILVIVGGAELFTGNNLMVMAYASGKVRANEVLRAWGLVYVGNFLGGVAIALLVYLAAGYEHGGGAVGLAALASAESKASLSALQAVVHGILANVLVCLATWLCFSARTTTDKILAIVPPIAAFVAAGFEHSVANVYLLSFALLTKFGAPGMFWDAIGRTPSAFPHVGMLASLTNLLWVTLGNMMGGMLVGITYWLIYLRTARTGTSKPQ
jgi:formate/nitrite transporter